MGRFKENIKNLIFRVTLKILGRSEMRSQLLTKEEKQSLNIVNNGYLVEIGWWRSFKENASLTKNNLPLPWVTYSFINFIEKRLNTDMVLFEYGSGNSTFFYSQNVKFVHSVEHDKKWFDKVNIQKKDNVNLIYRDLNDSNEYEKSILEGNTKYDIIIVDGRRRVNCLEFATQAIKDNGIIVLDDSEREQYLKGKKMLIDNGYQELDLWGISPGFISYNKCTSIFYRSDNIIGI